MPAKESPVVRLPPKGLIRVVGWAIVLGCMASSGPALLDTWNSSANAGDCGRNISFSGDQSALLLLAIATATLLFIFLTNLWVVMGLGLISFAVFLFSAIILAFASCGSPSSSTSYVVFFAVVAGTMTIVAAATLSLPIRIAVKVIDSLNKRRASGKTAWPENISRPQAAMAAGIAALTIGLLLIAGGWQGIMVSSLLGGLAVLAVGAWFSVRK